MILLAMSHQIKIKKKTIYSQLILVGLNFKFILKNKKMNKVNC